MKKRLLYIAAIAALAVIAAPMVYGYLTKKTVTDVPRAENNEAEAWADSVMATLTPHERVCQLVVSRIDATESAESLNSMQQAIKRNSLGGILLGKGTLRSYAKQVNAAQEVAKVPLLITLDGEWGLAMRVTDAPRFPYAMALGAITDTTLLYDYGRELGRECRAIGINVDFAPVLDVNSNPDNPVIGFRSFGEDAERVAQLGVAFSQGMESQGVMAVAKHFPGHGDTNADSHKTLPKVTHSRTMLENIDLLPFRRFIAANLGGVMVGHLNVPALDASGTPASLSQPITGKLLKEEMGFKGLVFTDALGMKGAAGGKMNICVAALKAGADVLLSPASPAADIKAVEDAVARGELTQKMIDERCHKMLKYKYLLGCNKFKPIDVASIEKVMHSEWATDINQRLSDGSVVCTRNRENLLPVRDLAHRKVAVAVIGSKADCTFATYCKKYAPCTVVAINDAPTRTQLSQLEEADVVVAAVTTDTRWARDAMSKICDIPNSVGAFMLNPYKLTPFASSIKRLDAVLMAFDNIPSMQRAMAEAVFGGIDVTGRCPVNVNGVMQCGEGLDLPKCRLSYASPLSVGFAPGLEADIDAIIKADIAAKAMSGCQILVAKDGRIVFEKGYGNIDFGADAAPVTTETLFDLASVTKTNATLAGLMKAYDEGLFELDDRIGNHIPEIDSMKKGDITVRELLFHESGMPAVINIYKLALDRKTYSGSVVTQEADGEHNVKMGSNEYGSATARLRKDIYSSTYDAKKFPYAVAKDIYVSDDGVDEVTDAVHHANLHAKNYTYSCLNFVLLRELQENLTGVELDQWIDTEIYAPLGAWHTLYQPLSRFSLNDIAATERDKMLRRQHVHGYVHDEMAAFSGGVQGNAGLFSTAGDIAKLCQMWLSGGAYGGERILSEETTRLFTTTHSKSGRRGLGFDMLRHNSSLSSPAASTNTYGHTGFTGTCYWVDPDRNLIFVFLSNRVNPSRDNSAWSRTNPRGTVLRKLYSKLL